MRKLMPLAAALSLAASCSLSLDTSKLDPLKTPDGYCKVLFDEFLRHWTSCYPATQQWFDVQYGQMSSMCDAIAGSKSRGAIVYDEGAARAWIDKIRSASCAANLDDLIHNADSPLVGQIPNGGDCADNIECADDRAECRSVDATCPGTCLTRGTLGAPCSAGYPSCAAGYYCSSTGTCTGATPDSVDCSAIPSNCGTGAYCWYCGPACVPQYQCRPYVAEGGQCNSTDRQCDTNGDAWLFCDELNSGTCKPGGSLVQGQRCNPGQCDGATFCDGSPGLCRLKFGSGSPCVSGECMPPLDCIGDSPAITSGTCLPRRQVGEQCLGGSWDCVMGAYCTAPWGLTATCQPWPSAFGQPCGALGGEWAPCLAGWCDMGGVIAAGVCRPFLPPGTDCASSPDACGSNGPGEAAWCDWATVGGSAVQVCVPGCLTP